MRKIQGLPFARILFKAAPLLTTYKETGPVDWIFFSRFCHCREMTFHKACFRLRQLIPLFSALGLTLALSACQGSSASPDTSPDGKVPLADALPALAVKYVSYDEGSGPISSEAQAERDIHEVNRLWKPCGVRFRLARYLSVNPNSYGLSSGAAAANETSAIRNAFSEPDSLLVVYTGNWNTVKNAWTAMPGSAPYGAVLESSVVDYPNIVAHELGHYLGLDHVSNGSNIMSTLIYPSSTALTESQCQIAQRTISQYWSAMLK